MRSSIFILVVVWSVCVAMPAIAADDTKSKSGNPLAAITKIVTEIPLGKGLLSSGATQGKKVAGDTMFKEKGRRSAIVKNRKPDEKNAEVKKAPPHPSKESIPQKGPVSPNDNGQPPKKGELKKMSKEEYVEYSNGLLDATPEILDGIPELKKAMDPEGKRYYTYSGARLSDLDVDKLQKIYIRIQGEYVKISTERINKQVQTIMQTRQAAMQAEQAARASRSQVPPPVPQVNLPQQMQYQMPQQVMHPPVTAQTPPQPPRTPPQPPPAPPRR